MPLMGLSAYEKMLCKNKNEKKEEKVQHHVSQHSAYNFFCSMLVLALAKKYVH
jgi:hypothetical protein